MNQVTDAYAKALLDLGVSPDDVDDADETLRCCGELSDALSNPVIPFAEKCSVIDKVFPVSLGNFFKVVCKNDRAADVPEIFRSYRSAYRKSKHCIKAVVEYVTPLTDEQIKRMTDYVKRKTGYDKVELSLVHNPEIMGGFILRAGDFRYDRSTRGAMAELKKSLIKPGADAVTERNKKSPYVMRAVLEYVTPPTEEQKERIIELIRKKTGYSEVELSLTENKDLIGGFILRAGNLRYDRSAVREVTDMRRKLMRR